MELLTRGFLSRSTEMMLSVSLQFLFHLQHSICHDQVDMGVGFRKQISFSPSTIQDTQNHGRTGRKLQVIQVEISLAGSHVPMRLRGGGTCRVPDSLYKCDSRVKILLGGKTRSIYKGEKKNTRIQIQIPGKMQTGSVNQRNIVLDTRKIRGKA